jgi:hypothetical protein
VQKLAREDCDLTQYIRKPNIAITMANRPMSVEEQEVAKNIYRSFYKDMRGHCAGMPYNPPLKDYKDSTEAEREAYLECLWPCSGFVFLVSNYPERIFVREANEFVYDFWANKVRARMRDEEKKDIVVPLEKACLSIILLNGSFNMTISIR